MSPTTSSLVLARNEHAFAVMNAYPYGSGHLMVAPARHEPTLAGLSRDEAAALMELVQDANVAVLGAYTPDGINVGRQHRPGRGRGHPRSRPRARPARGGAATPTS